MNTYNDNLHATVVSVLDEQELEQKKLKAQRNAALFSHYYAQGAVIVALEKLKIARQELESKERVNEQAVNISNISNSLLDFAKQENKHVAQAVTNTAVSAANVEIAANAILRLASDIGSVFNIINASDLGTEIQQHASEANELMNIVAYDAEKTSQFAMEAASLTAEISSNTLVVKVDATNTLIENLFKVTASELEEVSNMVKTDNILFAQISNEEEKAEGNLKANNITLTAVEIAYNTSNKKLNLNLRVLEKVGSSDNYSVSFEAIKSPYKIAKQLVNSPVEKYILFLVKEKNKNIFNLDKAEQIVANGSNSMNFKEVKKFDDTVELSITRKALYDTDGEELKLGEQYVIFVNAIYKAEYKTRINNFEDFLSAPSLPFSLTQSLIGPNIKFFKVEEERIITPFNETIETTFSFSIQTKTNQDIPLVYRCMFLPSLIARQNQYHEVNSEKPYFNLLLAEQVPRANYFEATLETDAAKKGKANTETYIAKLDAESTDIYGDIMVKGNSYTPVVLTIPSVEFHLKAEYTNAISNAMNTKPFVFQKLAD